jgi:hypothetical protein
LKRIVNQITGEVVYLSTADPQIRRIDHSLKGLSLLFALAAAAVAQESATSVAATDEQQTLEDVVDSGSRLATGVHDD